MSVAIASAVAHKAAFAPSQAVSYPTGRVAADSYHDAVAAESIVAPADLAAVDMICVDPGMVAADSSPVEVVADANSYAAADRLRVTVR